LPDGVRVIGADELRRGRRAWFHEQVAGVTFRDEAEPPLQPGARRRRVDPKRLQFRDEFVEVFGHWRHVTTNDNRSTIRGDSEPG
jgi:hypothetical protein